MVNMQNVCIFVLAILFCQVASDSDHGDAVVNYTSEDFDAALEQSKLFVMFYAPWCGHCKRLSPTWNELAKLYNPLIDQTLIIGKVDCTVETALCAKHEITGYPTLKFFHDKYSEVVRYKSARDIQSLNNFIEEQLSNSPEQPEANVPTGGLFDLTDDSFPKHIETGSHFIKFYAPWCGHCKRLAPTWEDLAMQYVGQEDVSVAKVDCTIHRATCDSYGVRSYPTLLFFRNGEKVDEYQGGRTLEELQGYMDTQLAVKNVNADRTDEKIPEKIQEEEKPKENLAAIFELEADTFTAGISEGLTFVKFFAPWCGHCKRLAPTWEELSKEMARYPVVTIAKVDCTFSTNICKENGVRGYPTLILFKDGQKVTEYTGSRDLGDLVEFMLEHIPEVHDEL